MGRFRKSSEFQKLKSDWDKKLKDSGFVDAEREVDGFVKLKVATSDTGRFGDIFRHSKDKVKREAQQEYFHLLSQAVSRATDFEDDSDRLIMERTAEGKTIREISIELRSLLPEDRQRSKHNRDTIRYVRRRYENKWGVKSWKPEQMTSRKAPIKS